MPIAISTMILAAVIFYQYTAFALHKRAVYEKTGKYDKTNVRLSDNSRYSEHYADMSVDEEYRAAADNVETALVRVCRVINTLSMQNNCANKNSTATTWGFIVNNYDKNLADTWNGSTSSTFSCANSDSYARYLLNRSVPALYVQERGLKYNLYDVSDATGRHDPCGYIEVIGIDK